MTSETPLRLLGGLSTAAFLRDYWQKRPLLVRGAVPGIEPLLSPEELAGLACEECVESRLVLRGGQAGWELRHGPFTEEDFTALPARDWTLLVQDVDKHLPELAAVPDQFRFVPEWRIDDLMISYAPQGGGVGPHVDAYDVFLLQAAGRRRWRIDPRPASLEWLPDLELKVLKSFQPNGEWVLEAGDMLYLPPGVAHEGTSRSDDCMTWSIGFRAPSLREMFSDFAELRLGELPEERRYADPDLTPEEADEGLISPAALTRARRLMREALDPDDAQLDRWFGRFITEPKYWLRPAPAADAPDPAELRRRLQAGWLLLRDPGARLAWTRSGTGLVLFANGETLDLAPALEPLVRLLCRERAVSFAALKRYLERDGVLELLSGLCQTGTLECVENE